MLVANSDETLLPLMTNPEEVKDVTIWGATYGQAFSANTLG